MIRVLITSPGISLYLPIKSNQAQPFLAFLQDQLRSFNILLLYYSVQLEQDNFK